MKVTAFVKQVCFKIVVRYMTNFVREHLERLFHKKRFTLAQSSLCQDIFPRKSVIIMKVGAIQMTVP